MNHSEYGFKPIVTTKTGTDRLTIAEFRELQASKTTTKRSKYSAQKTTSNGRTFDSKREACRYEQLKIMEQAGLITGIMPQVKFKLEGCSYFADFVYFDCKSRTWVVEDSKGFRTSGYKQKARQMKERYGIVILET